MGHKSCKRSQLLAIEAVELAIEQYPYSSALLIKKADSMIAARHYNDALKILKQAELLDGADINLYILKTDVYLALDQQEKAVTLLQHALEHFDGEERIELLFELADVYKAKGDKIAMINEYLDVLETEDSYILSVQNALQTSFGTRCVLL